MKWHDVKCIRYTTEKDALGNNIPNGTEVLLETKGRMTPWNAAELAMKTYEEQRKVTRDLQKYLLLAFDNSSDALEVDGSVYPVTDIERFGRYVQVTVDKFKVL